MADQLLYAMCWMTLGGVAVSVVWIRHYLSQVLWRLNVLSVRLSRLEKNGIDVVVGHLCSKDEDRDEDEFDHSEWEDGTEGEERPFPGDEWKF